MSAASEILAKPLCALAFCWRLERRDGVTIGLTSHDRAFVAHGLHYEAAPGITPSAIVRGGDDPELTDVQGALSAAAITEADLEAGRWDGASVLLNLTEWTEPGVLWLELVRGSLGSIERRGKAYSASLRSSLGTLFEKVVSPATSPTCRAVLGDRDCRVDLRRHQRILTVRSADDAIVEFAGAVGADFPFGTLRWLEGTNSGLVQAVVDQEGDTLHLTEAPLFPVQPGIRALLTEGCDKQLATCSARFANALNFRGEPHLPGMDLLTRYPGS